jgi:hypothetical protein
MMNDFDELWLDYIEYYWKRLGNDEDQWYNIRRLILLCMLHKIVAFFGMFH